MDQRWIDGWVYFLGADVQRLHISWYNECAYAGCLWIMVGESLNA